MTDEWKTYAKALSRQLRCPRDKKRQFLEETRRLAEDYLAGDPNAGHAGLTAFLGDPGELARSYQESLGPEVMERYRRQRRLMRSLVCAAAVAVVLGTYLYRIYLAERPHEATLIGTKVIVVHETEEPREWEEGDHAHDG